VGEIEKALAEALAADQLQQEEICQRVDMRKVLELFPGIRVGRLAWCWKVLLSDGQVWVYNPSDGMLRNREREELDKIEWYGRMCGYAPEVARVELANRSFWRERGEAEGAGLAVEGEDLPGFTFADLDFLLGDISWLWKPWLPKGMVSMLVGKTGVGKSALAMAIASGVTDGRGWPDGTSPAEGPGLVVWVETESCHGLNRERATKWGLSKDRILIPAVGDDPLMGLYLDTKEGWRAVEREVAVEGVQLVIVDSMRGAYRGDENTSDTIVVLRKLAELAQRREIAVLVVHHLRKASMFDSDKIELDRVRGSSAITQIPRAVWAVDRPDSLVAERVRLQEIKLNLGKLAEPCGFVIGDEGITWTDAPSEPVVETQRDKAADLIMSLLRDGPMLALEIYEEGDGAAISKRTLKRAKKVLGVVATRRENRWWWALPAR